MPSKNKRPNGSGGKNRRQTTFYSASPSLQRNDRRLSSRIPVLKRHLPQTGFNPVFKIENALKNVTRGFSKYEKESQYPQKVQETTDDEIRIRKGSVLRSTEESPKSNSSSSSNSLYFLRSKGPVNLNDDEIAMILLKKTKKSSLPSKPSPADKNDTKTMSPSSMIKKKNDGMTQSVHEKMKRISFPKAVVKSQAVSVFEKTNRHYSRSTTANLQNAATLCSRKSAKISTDDHISDEDLNKEKRIQKISESSLVFMDLSKTGQKRKREIDELTGNEYGCKKMRLSILDIARNGSCDHSNALTFQVMKGLNLNETSQFNEISCRDTYRLHNPLTSNSSKTSMEQHTEVTEQHDKYGNDEPNQLNEKQEYRKERDTEPNQTNERQLIDIYNENISGEARRRDKKQHTPERISFEMNWDTSAVKNQLLNSIRPERKSDNGRFSLPVDMITRDDTPQLICNHNMLSCTGKEILSYNQKLSSISHIELFEDTRTRQRFSIEQEKSAENALKSVRGKRDNTNGCHEKKEKLVVMINRGRCSDICKTLLFWGLFLAVLIGTGFLFILALSVGYSA